MFSYNEIMEAGRISLAQDDYARAAVAYAIASAYGRTRDEYAAAILAHVVALGSSKEHGLALAAAFVAAESLNESPDVQAQLRYLGALSAGTLGRAEDGLKLARQAWPELTSECRAQLAAVFPQLRENCS